MCSAAVISAHAQEAGENDDALTIGSSDEIADLIETAPGGLEERMHLHARSLQLPHPDGNVIALSAPLPNHFLHAFDMLGFDPSEKFELLEDDE